MTGGKGVFGIREQSLTGFGGSGGGASKYPRAVASDSVAGLVRWVGDRVVGIKGLSPLL